MNTRRRTYDVIWSVDREHMAYARLRYISMAVEHRIVEVLLLSPEILSRNLNRAMIDEVRRSYSETLTDQLKGE
jgi:hypothetical protein